MELLLLIGGLILVAVVLDQRKQLAKLNSQIPDIRRRIVGLSDYIISVEERLPGEGPPKKQQDAAEKAPDTASMSEAIDEPTPNNTIQEMPTEAPISDISAAKSFADNQKSEPKEEAIPNAGDAGKAAFGNLEKDLSTKWLLWAGGAILALGGAFLVKYSVDAGLLGPAARIALGIISGAAMTAGGEYLRRKRSAFEWTEKAPDYLPTTIAAAGIFFMLASIFAGYALFDFFPPIIAYVGLSAVAIGASLLAFWHGRYMAWLGLLAGMLIPALVSTGGGNPWALFPFIGLIAVASLWIAREKAWADVAIGALTAATLWVPAWIITRWEVQDIIPVGLFILLIAAANHYTTRGASPYRASDRSLNSLIPTHIIGLLGDMINAALVILVVSLVRIDHYGAVSLMLALVSFGALFALAMRDQEFDVGGLAAVLGTGLLLLTWHTPQLINSYVEPALRDGGVALWSPVLSPNAIIFMIASLIAAIAVSGPIIARLPKLGRQTLWGAIAAATPPLIMILVWWRIRDFDSDIPFAITSMIMALIMSAAAYRFNQKAHWSGDTAVAGFAAAATASLSLAFVMILRDATLTLALTLQLAALGWIWRQTRIKGLRIIAILLALAVLVRLFLNPELLEYHGGTGLIFNWLLWAYLIPSGLFVLAGRLFKDPAADDKKADGLADLLSVGAVMLGVAYTTLELRVLLTASNQIDGDPTNFEAAIQTINWALASLTLYYHYVRSGRMVFGWLSRIMSVATALALLAGGGIASNVFISDFLKDIDGVPLFNIMTLQLVLPALIYGTKAWLANGYDHPKSAKIYGLITFGLGLFWISSEIRFAFWYFTDALSIGEWEMYSYSVAWLLVAVGVIVTGLRIDSQTLRKGGLVMLAVVVLKVFLIDMGALEGLARALSFIGLGGAMIGLGYLYQRLTKREAA